MKMDETTEQPLTATCNDQHQEDEEKPSKPSDELEYDEISNTSENYNDKASNEEGENREDTEEEKAETENVKDNEKDLNKNEGNKTQNNENNKTDEEYKLENQGSRKNVNNDEEKEKQSNRGNQSLERDNNSQEDDEKDQVEVENDNEDLTKDDKESSSRPDIEEVDAEISLNKANQDDEEDVLSDDRTQTTEKQKSRRQSQMDIDDSSNNRTSVNEDTFDETSKTSNVQDVEMSEISETEKTSKRKETDKFDQLFENTRKSIDTEPMETEDNEYGRDNEPQEESREHPVENRDELDNVTPSESTENPESEITENQTENVQEEEQGESADVCLIPDNDEELTGAEKEQAILARQNAEKEDAEKEQAESETVEVAIDQEKELQEPDDSQTNVDDVPLEPDLSEERTEVEDRTETPLPTKTAIISIIHTDQKCVECKENKSCEFRYKNDENDKFLYVCDQQCCDALINKDKTRFFVRKRKFIVEDLSELKTASCIVCKDEKQCKYTFKQDEDTIYICNDDCYNLLSKEETDKLKLKRNSIRVKNLSSSIVQEVTTKNCTSEPKIIARTAHEAELAKLDRDASFVRRCMNCCMSIHVATENLIWETLDFCSQLCLSKYQYSIGEKCRTCTRPVSQASLGKYCVRFGFEICQFCCAACLDKYKKSLKNCSYCQKDISKTNEGFLAPVGDNEQFKDFCSQHCMKKYDTSMNPKRKSKIEQCSVCNNKKMVQVELTLDGRGIYFCSHPCFSAFKFVNNIIPDKCTLCTKYFERKSIENFTIYNDKTAQIFCGRICMNIFISQNRKIVFCQWCKVKKYNFDMIEKHSKQNEKLTFCSLNCLVFYGVSLNRIAKQKVKCDYCMSEKAPQYHLTMSDSTMRNFCTYQCVMQFQSRFSSTPLTLDNSTGRQNQLNQLEGNDRGNLPVPTGLPKRIKSNVSSVQSLQVPLAPTQSTMPIIANITSLAPESASRKRNRARSKNKSMEKAYSQINQNVSQHRPYGSQMHSSKSSGMYSTPKIKVPKKTTGTGPKEPANKTYVVELPADPKLKSNMNTQCMPLMETVGITCKPQSCDSEIQTDSDLKSKKLIPVPIPIYIPQPIQGYPTPKPIPIPFVFPIPIPIFIPTTKNGAQGIMKEIKKLQDKMPADPYEAELLMMAELVASDKKKEEESDEENNDVHYSNDNSYGEDVLQMALKMATEYDETPSVDLGPTINNDSTNLMYHQMQVNQRASRGKKRTTPTNNLPRENNDQPVIKKRRPSEDTVITPSQNVTVEKPDANMCLKYTFGVNAWKQWVMTKNAEIEKSTIRRKQFKSELLQMTADELSYSLCLFVKEVRKPNGTEYAPDTIYYLVLGIQQYLYENGRIDNIFTDPYYERFTDCLDEVARKFSILYNDSQYIVTRVEEEHLWECKQLGAHSPHVLLSTLMFFNTKHFNLTTVEEHMQLSFSHIMKHWKRNPQGAKQPGSRNVLLRFYPPNTGQADNKKKKVYEQQENEANPLRCPVRLYEFYLSKCPESVKTRNDVFYLQPERSCVPDSPVWYSTQPLSQESLQKMLHRVKMVKEINVALLTI